MNALVNWDNQKLEPVLITYNRSAELQRTLAAFIDAGLTFIKLHVLDNASTDETAAVVASAQARWPNLSYHRNITNIGGNANILRAVEISTSEYSWIIGDDDAWHLEDISELSAVCARVRQISSAWAGWYRRRAGGNCWKQPNWPRKKKCFLPV